MDEFIYLGLIILVFILIVGIPTGLSFLLHRYFKRKNFPLWIKALAFIPVLVLCYTIFTAVFPNDDFYEIDYKEVTGLEFPEDAEILNKSTSFPDNFGDYTSVFLVRTSPEKYLKLFNHLKDKGFDTVTDESYLRKSLDEIVHSKLKVKTALYFITDNSKDFYVAFLSDSRSILIRRISW